MLALNYSHFEAFCSSVAKAFQKKPVTITAFYGMVFSGCICGTKLTSVL